MKRSKSINVELFICEHGLEICARAAVGSSNCAGYVNDSQPDWFDIFSFLRCLVDRTQALAEDAQGRGRSVLPQERGFALELPQVLELYRLCQTLKGKVQ